MTSTKSLIKDHLNKSIHNGERARQDEDNFGKIKVFFEEEDVTEIVTNWLIKTKYRTPEDIKEFINFLSNDVEIKLEKKKQKLDRKLRKKIGRDTAYQDYINDRKSMINDMITDHEKRLEGNWVPKELDIVLASDIIYAREKVIADLKKMKQILKSIQVIKGRHNINTKVLITKKLANVLFSEVLVELRILEYIIKIDQKIDLGMTQELLEWDLNTLEFTMYHLEQYVHSVIKQKWAKDWTEEVQEDNRELIRLFSDGV